ncbi:hypothetical protein JHK82_050991 [Glycine max]|nr:hypothetical protein JHK86_050850 [Glycine max]KAG4936773.1 hypothetical protein JHK85_051692 [Glycine max]KAG5092213.1 hypothetical protein JHK82_050991 [Glycine max]KAG5095294.1 hypothetical protein JHK84_050882 [Glycine max]
MSALQMSHVDLEQGNGNHRRSVVGSDVSGEGSLCFSDVDDGSCYSRFYSTNGGSYDDYSFACVSDAEVGGVPHSGRASSASECSVEVEARSGVPEIKDDLAAAHKHCAEAWFKIKGNRTCEICHSVARNVYGGHEESTEHLSDANNAITAATLSTPAPSAEPRRFWHGHRFLNFLLACMVFAFVISWLFHFNVPSS